MPSEGSTPPRQAFLTRPLVVLLLLTLLATAIYSNTFFAPFQFDDIPNIFDNPRIKDLVNFRDLSGSRYVGFFSFALNYHFGGLNVFGYHLVNLIIHILNGFLVYQFVLLIGGSFGVALSTSLLFISHPLQTQAVTYIVQRFTSLAALFYLLALVSYLKWRKAEAARPRTPWYALALLSTVLAMKTKEISFTLPLMISLLELMFFGDYRKNRWIAITPFLMTLLLIPISHSDVFSETGGGLTRQTSQITRMDYLLTQCRVMVTYLRLLFFPARQNLDYNYPIYHSILDPPVFLSFLLLLFLLSAAVFLCNHFRLQAFGIFWFFLALSVESSIIPIQDMIFEHRIYLPSVGIFLLIGLIIATKRLNWVIPIILILLSITAFQRNRIWRDELSLWSDAAAKSPDKARPHLALGEIYLARSRFSEAIPELQTALGLNPRLVLGHFYLGEAYAGLGLPKEATAEYQNALRLKPDYADAHKGLGSVYKSLGRFEEAIREYQIALQLKPDYAQAHNSLGVAYIDQGHLEEAIREFQTALQLQPNYLDVHYNLGLAYRSKGMLQAARSEFEQALRIKPDFLPARQALDSLLH